MVTYIELVVKWGSDNDLIAPVLLLLLVLVVPGRVVFTYSYKFNASNNKDVVTGIEQKPAWHYKHGVPDVKIINMYNTSIVVSEIRGCICLTMWTANRYVNIKKINTSSGIVVLDGTTRLLLIYNDATVWHGINNSNVGIMLKHEH